MLHLDALVLSISSCVVLGVIASHGVMSQPLRHVPALIWPRAPLPTLEADRRQLAYISARSPNLNMPQGSATPCPVGKMAVAPLHCQHVTGTAP
jgi:hypothetical protein